MAQTGLVSCHLAAVAFMIVAGEMKQAVQGEDFDLVGNGMAQQSGISSGDLGGDSDIAGGRRVSGSVWQFRGEGKHIRWFIFSAKLAIQRAHMRIAGD